MADIGQQQQWLVSPDIEVERMWLDIKIQEKRSMIARCKQEIEDLEAAKIVSLRAKILMLEKEMAMLIGQKSSVDVSSTNVS